MAPIVPDYNHGGQFDESRPEGSVRTRRRTEITVRTAEVYVIKQSRRTTPAWCAQCREWVQMVRPDEAVALVGTTSRLIHRRVENGTVHYTETPDGFLLICLKSLGR